MKLSLTAATQQTDCNLNGRAHGDVVAICLEHDVVMQGHDQHDAIIALSAGIASMVQYALETGADPIQNLGGPPPAEEIASFTGPRVSFTVDTDEWKREP